MTTRGCGWCAQMYALRFGEEPPARRSVDQLRGIEGARVREIYKAAGARHGVSWEGRDYDPTDWGWRRRRQPLPLGGDGGALWPHRGGRAGGGLCAGDRLPAHRQAAELRLRHRRHLQVRDRGAGGVPGRRGGAGRRPLDGRPVGDPVAAVRRRCRDAFRRTDVLARLIPAIEEVLAAGGLPLPEAPPEAMPVAFEDAGGMGDAGHRG